MAGFTTVWNGAHWVYVATLANGAPVDGSAAPSGGLSVSSVNTQPTTDYIHNLISSTVNYTANATSGDTLGLVSYMSVNANGFAAPANTEGHTSAIYGNAFAGTTGTVGQVNGVMAVSGNGGTGVLDTGVDFFGHPNYKAAGGTINNHFFLYQEPSTAAIHEYGAYFSAPVGIGTKNPLFNLEIQCNVAGNILANNGFHVDFGGPGSFTVTNGGAVFYPGYQPGPGGLGVTDLIVGTGSPNTTTGNGNFLFISACPGPPTTAPFFASAGRVALTFDTVNHKLWAHDGTSWRGIVLT